MIRLSKRLKIIHDMVPESVVADLGSDHGKLMIALGQSGKVKKGFAVENKEGPFERFRSNLIRYHVNDKVTPLFSDGIKDITRDVATIVIAGMGGQTIVNILKAHPEKLVSLQTIIIDAHTSVPLVRKEISQMGFAIADERIVKEDGIFYEIIKFIRADIAALTNEDLEFGPVLRHEKCATFKEKYQSRIDEIDNIIAKGNLPESRIAMLNEEKHKLERYI